MSESSFTVVSHGWLYETNDMHGCTSKPCETWFQARYVVFTAPDLYWSQACLVLRSTPRADRARVFVDPPKALQVNHAPEERNGETNDDEKIPLMQQNKYLSKLEEDDVKRKVVWIKWCVVLSIQLIFIEIQQNTIMTLGWTWWVWRGPYFLDDWIIIKSYTFDWHEFYHTLILKVTSYVIPLQGLADNKKHLVQFLKYDDHEQKYAWLSSLFFWGGGIQAMGHSPKQEFSADMR